KRDGRGARFLQVLFWFGVGLSPLAALMLLISQSGLPLRLAGVFAVLAVVLIGLSITLRRGDGALGHDVEHLVVDEVEALRDELREDITAAARATHRSLGEKVIDLHETVDALRDEVDTLRGEFDQPALATRPAVAA